MDYKELVRRLYQHNENYGQGRTQDFFRVCLDCKEAATAITDLLARAEAAERERDQLREAMKPNCLLCDSMHPDNGNCTAVGGFCTAVPAAHCPLIPRLRDKLEAAEKCIAEIEEAIKFGRYSAAMLRISDLKSLGYEEKRRSNVLPGSTFDIILKEPAADVAPVVHGRWIGKPLCGNDNCRCSICGSWFNVHASLRGDITQIYCPNCGAKMDLDTANKRG